MVGLDQAVHHFGQIFSFNAEFPWAAALPNGQHHVACAILAFERADSENPVLTFLDILDFLTLPNLEIGALADFLPEGDQVFFG